MRGEEYLQRIISRFIYGILFAGMLFVMLGNRTNAMEMMSTQVGDGGQLKLESPYVVGSYSKKKIKLTWKKVKDAEAYYIYKKNADGKYVQIGETEKLSYKDKDVEKNKTYRYKVAAVRYTEDEVVRGKKSATCVVLASAIDPNKKMVALTYDDGPGKYTKEIVKCLKENQAKATFFVLGCNVDSYKEALVAADKIGCEIANHSYSHSNLTGLSENEIREEVKKTDKKVKKIIGKTPALMRTPGGALDDVVKKQVKKPIILWSIDTLDWKHRNSEKTIQAVMGNVQDGDIVLMHDIHESTKTASLSLIPQLRREGYQLVTVSELARYCGYKLKKGEVYHSLRKKK